jgi:hypothetical protein
MILMVSDVATCRYPEDRVPAYKFQVKTTAPASLLGAAPGPHVSLCLRLPARGSSEAATCLHGSGSRLPTRGSSGAVTCLHGSGSRLPARGSSGAVICHLGSSTHFLAQGSSRDVTCPKDGLCRLQAIKQIFPGDPAIMTSIGARVRVSFKALRDKGCSARLRVVQRVAH